MPDGITWTSRTPAADNNWGSITYGSGLFVAVSSTGTGNRVMTSPDGITWTSRSTFAADNQWYSVTYGNGLFVAVSTDGTGNRVMTSPDGITWTSRVSAANNQWQSVTYGNGVFVAVAASGSGNRVMTSPDGITWTSRTSAADNGWLSVTYGNGLFVAVAASGTGNRIMTSPDGINWTSRISAADNQWRSVIYGNGLFVAVASSGTSNRVMTSPDGITWTSRSSAADNSWYSVTYGNGLFVAVALSGTGNRVMTSPDGITWTSRSSAADNNWFSITYGNGVFVAVATSGTGNRVMTSPDGITWTSRSSAADNNWFSVTYGNGVFVAVSQSGTSNRVMTSSITPSLTIAANPGNVIATGTSVIFTATPTNGGSTPAYQWKKNNINVGSNSATYIDASLNNNDIITCVLTSNDPCALTATATSTSITMEVSSLCPIGITWTSRTSAADNNWSSVIYGNGLFVAVSTTGAGNRVMTSPDGINWTSRTSAADNPWTSLTYGNGLFVAVSNSGTGNRVMTSPNGINWTSRSSSADNNWNSVTYGNGIFVAVASSGTGNRVMTSPDGVNWTSRSSASDEGWLSVTYGNGLFVAVGFGLSSNKVMTSPDGITWTSRTSADDNKWWFSVTYGNGLFVAVAGTGTSNRVMTSPDGITWISRSSAANNSWNSVTYGNGRFVAVSSDGIGNRVMTSPDGITWTSRTSASDNSWSSVTYGNGLFAAVAYSGIGNRVMTSSPALVTPSLSIAANPGNSITMGTSVTFTATPTNGGSTPAYQWKKNNNNVGSNSATYTDAALANGDNITCVLTSNNPCASTVNTTSTGITMVVISPSTNANLSALLLSTGTLSPSFASATINYSATVNNATTSITLTPTRSEANATIQVRVNGGTYASVSSGSASSALALNVGSNTINVLVTAQDASTKTYTITVTRAASSNADLSALTLSTGTLSPNFASATTSYTSSVSNATNSITVTPTLADTTARVQVRVNGGTYASVSSSVASSSLVLNVGSNTINVLVTAQDASTKTYTITVTRAASSNADLSALTLSTGTLSPIFASATTSYTSSVSNATNSITVTPTLADTTARVQVRVNGGTYASVSSSVASSSLVLNVGSNTINVLVTAQDASTKTYTITVTRLSLLNLPTISSFTPTSGSIGTLVSIVGTNLSAIDTLRIGGVSAIKISAKSDTLVAMVMPGAITGSIYLANAGGNVTSGTNFTYVASVPPMAQQGNKLVGTGASGQSVQGSSVSLSADGNTAIVGAYLDSTILNVGTIGAVWIYTRSGGVWSQQGNKLVGTGGNTGFSGINQGTSVDISADGNTVVVGGPLDDNGEGAAWIFTRSGTTWSQQGSKLVGTGASGAAYQGHSVSISADGNTVLVGGYNDFNTGINGNGNGNGATWVFTRSNGVWSQQGSKLVGTGNSGPAAQGYSVDISADGNTAVIGGPKDNIDSIGNSVGAAWFFTRSSGIWSQQGSKLVGTGVSGVNANQGSSVALSADGNTAIVGSPGDSAIGATWVFMRSGSTCSQQGNKLVGTGAIGSGNQGNSVSLSADGNTAMVGGWNDDSGIGATWVFNRSGSVWTQQGSKLLGTGAIGWSNQGYSVSLSADGNTAMVGGHNDDSNIGAAWVFNGAANNVQTQLSLTAFLEGLYLGSSSMTAAPFNADGLTSNTIADTLTIVLHDKYNFDSVFAVTSTINTSGLAIFNLPAIYTGNAYYIAIKNRNSLETWTADTVLITSTTSYNFSDNALKAYGSNMVNLGSGLYGIYAGDINQDGSIDFIDYPVLDIGSINGDLGYLATDLNGDASVDFLDYPLIDLNSINGIVIMRP